MGGCLVLIYHRVTELENDPFQLAISPAKFKSQIEYLKKKMHILTLGEFLNRIKQNDSLSNCVLITFDDGYADNFIQAKPILEQLETPAVFFITTGMINKNKEFWWDELEKLFYSTQSLSSAQLAHIIRKKYSWDINHSENRQNILFRVHRYLKILPYEKREKVLDDLFNLVEHNRNSIRPTHRIMNADEIRDLSHQEFFEIGSHSMNHCAFKSLSRSASKHEIEYSKNVLESISGHSIVSFCYPFGLKHDLSRRAARMIRKAGYSCAFTNIPGLFFRNDNIFKISRCLVRNWDVSELKENLLINYS